MRDEITNTSKTTKGYTRTTAKSYLEEMICEPCRTFEHVPWVPNTQVSQDNSLHTNHEYYTNKNYTCL